MRALGFYEHGELDKMAIIDVAKPKPKANEILLQIKASAFNHLDIWVRRGWPGLNLPLPHVSGSDAAGIITECGSEVTDLQVGDRVALDPGFNLLEDEFTWQGEQSVSPGYRIIGEDVAGTHTEFIAVLAKNVVKIPETISFEIAAASGLVALTAWRMLMQRAKIVAGEKILIHGAGGGVNSIAIQLAKIAGCEVYATTSSNDKVAKAQALGADVVLNYRTNQQWQLELQKLTGKKGFDVVVDNVGRATLNDSLRLVKRGGRIVIVGNTSGPITELDIRYVFSKQISILGSTMGNHQDYINVMQLIFNGKITPPIHSIFSLEQGIQAMALLERQEQFGKILLKP